MRKENTFKTILLVTTTIIITDLAAQNVGIGTNEPLEKLQVNGNLLVQGRYRVTNELPKDSQNFTLINGTDIGISDSIARIFDPGGPSGNYLDNLSATASFFHDDQNVGFEMTIENINLGAGDSLIVINPFGENPDKTILKVGNNYSLNGRYIFSTRYLQIKFKSNSDGQTGSGFSLLIKRLYLTTNADTTYNNTSVGNALFFDATKGIFRAGLLSSESKGLYSSAMGFETSAIGDYSTAMGYQSYALGKYSVAIGNKAFANGDFSYAMGDRAVAGNRSIALGSGVKSIYAAVAIGEGSTATNTYSIALGFYDTASGSSSTAVGTNANASGGYSTAIGFSNYSSGTGSTALGNNTTASGDYSTAMGRGTIASGISSTAMGNYVSTNSFDGAFIIGDNSNSTVLNSIAANSFCARFARGYRLYTNSAANVGAFLAGNDNSWSIMSNVHRKENFEPVNGEDFLKKISSFKLSSWNYKGQDSKTHRHYGPMAQDFHAAFGKDKFGTIGNDTTINQADFDGVNFIAIQALTKRTERLNAENASLRQEVAALQKKLDDQNNLVIKRLQQLETIAIKPKRD